MYVFVLEQGSTFSAAPANSETSLTVGKQRTALKAASEGKRADPK